MSLDKPSGMLYFMEEVNDQRPKGWLFLGVCDSAHSHFKRFLLHESYKRMSSFCAVSRFLMLLNETYSGVNIPKEPQVNFF